MKPQPYEHETSTTTTCMWFIRKYSVATLGAACIIAILPFSAFVALIFRYCLANSVQQSLCIDLIKLLFTKTTKYFLFKYKCAYVARKEGSVCQLCGCSYEDFEYNFIGIITSCIRPSM